MMDHGAPVRVVVVDSGVDVNHPGVRGRAQIVAGPSFGADGIEDRLGGARDLLGHGTAVAATILRSVQGVELVSLRVFDRTPGCDFAAVLHALRHALALRPAVVNLSLGTTSLRHRIALEAIVADARAAKVTIVAPATFGGLPCDPGGIAGVEAVAADPNLPPTAPELRTHAGRLLWFASPVPPPDADGVRRLCARGDSLAVAAVTGCLLRSRLA